ncbi:MAG: hypothetical protein LBQ15_00285, partial [Clostridium sp.]|nr:hypothetical protein [Clostridium sp.]
MKKKWRLAGCLFPVLLFYSLAFFPLSAEAIYDSPYVTWSPDGQAFTTNAGEKPAAQEPPGKRVATGAA